MTAPVPRTERGAAVAIVLIILAVISLIGVGLISQSQLDSRLTAGLGKYDKMVSLADAAANREFRAAMAAVEQELPMPALDENNQYVTTNDISLDFDEGGVARNLGEANGRARFWHMKVGGEDESRVQWRWHATGWGVRVNRDGTTSQSEVHITSKQVRSVQ